VSMLSAHEAYRLWAPTYTGENAVCVLEDQLVAAMTPSLAGKALLDAGCGVGLRSKGCGAAFAVGVDASPEMLLAGGLDMTAAADVRALPFRSASFDLVWCRLMLGYLADLHAAYAELARVCRFGGHLLATDFHADATTAGHKQTFRDAQGALHEISHYVYPLAAHIAAATEAGLSLIEEREGTVGPAIKHFYEKTGHLGMYERDEGLRIVAACLFERE
jgi:malonyl-CoA O-methyltransferase